jgi:hypothetical protein
MNTADGHLVSPYGPRPSRRDNGGMSTHPPKEPYGVGEWTALDRRVLARRASESGTRLRVIWHLPKGARVRVLRWAGNDYFVEVEDRRGRVNHALIPSDAFSPSHRNAAVETRNEWKAELRDARIKHEEDNVCIGTLGELLPEFAEWVQRALKEVGESDLGQQVGSFAIRACWPGRLHNFTLSSVPREARPLIWGDRDRKSLRLAHPAGVPRRRWQVGVVSVRGKLLEIGVVAPSVLRPALTQMASRFVRDRPPAARYG